MSFWSRLFGKKPQENDAVKPSLPQPEPQPKANVAKPVVDRMKLPPEFEGNRSYRDMFQIEAPDRLHAMCRELPIETLDLENPGASLAMGRAITQVFAVANYMATKAVPPEYGDAMFPRLIAKVTAYEGSALHLELCDLVRDFAVHLGSSGRHAQAVKVLRTLKASLFWRTWSQGNFCLFASLNNIAQETKQRIDFEAALSAAQDLPADQFQQAESVIKRLRQDLSNDAAPAADQPQRAKEPSGAEMMDSNKSIACLLLIGHRPLPEALSLVQTSSDVPVAWFSQSGLRLAKAIVVIMDSTDLQAGSIDVSLAQAAEAKVPILAVLLFKDVDAELTMLLELETQERLNVAGFQGDRIPILTSPTQSRLKDILTNSGIDFNAPLTQEAIPQPSAAKQSPPSKGGGIVEVKLATNEEMHARQLILRFSNGGFTSPKFGTLMLPGEMGLGINLQPHGAGLIKMSGENDPFFVIRSDDGIDKFRTCALVLTFSFCRFRSGAVVFIFVGVDLPGDDTPRGGLVEASIPLDSAIDGQVDLMEKTFKLEQLHVCFVKGGQSSGTIIAPDGSTHRYKMPEGQFDRTFSIPKQAADVLAVEYKALRDYHNSIPPTRRNLQSCMNDANEAFPQGQHPIIGYRFV